MPEPFSPEVATRLIHQNPGRTAQEIVEDALNCGIIGGTVLGQKGALSKMFNGGRLPDVRRDEERRPQRFYPRNRKGDGPTDRPESSSQVISFRPTPRQDRVVTALVSVGVASTRTDAVQWLLEQGISAKADYVERALATQAQIDELRRGMLADGQG
jgi:hypothetical protein